MQKKLYKTESSKSKKKWGKNIVGFNKRVHFIVVYIAFKWCTIYLWTVECAVQAQKSQFLLLFLLKVCH